MHHIIFNLRIAIDAIAANKVRAFLTALGIIFGVAAVISMMAIGSGAKQEILEQIKLVGVNNIIIKPIIDDSEEEVTSSKKESKKTSGGLTLFDAQSIKAVIPSVENVSAEVFYETLVIRKGKSYNAKIVGITPEYFDLHNIKVYEGKDFSDQQFKAGHAVCIIGKGIEGIFFSRENAIGKKIKCGNIWLKVIGVLKERRVSQAAISNLGIRNYNLDVYSPIQTVLIRYRNRGLITGKSLKRSSGQDKDKSKEGKRNYHQLNKLVVQVKETSFLSSTADVISRMLKRRHFGVIDYEISIPEMLLKQQQRTKDIFNVVLGAIAGISLVVGGIGIMNIMLASVMERIKEIGIRLSMGATKKDIVLQFVTEAVLISFCGGIIGVILGVLLAEVITRVAGILTIVSLSSIIISFGVSALVGLVFGIMPAKKAAEQDPVVSLRHE